MESLPREDPGPRLAVLFGGPHQSQPSFLRAKVGVGDLVFPVNVRQRRLHVLASMRVREIVEVDETDEEMGGLLPRFAEWSFLAPTCTSEVVIGEAGTPIRRDRIVDAATLADWCYLNRRGERRLRHIEGAQVMRHDSFDGIYRLHPTTAAALEQLVGPGLQAVTAPPR